MKYKAEKLASLFVHGNSLGFTKLQKKHLNSVKWLFFSPSKGCGRSFLIQMLALEYLLNNIGAFVLISDHYQTFENQTKFKNELIKKIESLKNWFLLNGQNLEYEVSGNYVSITCLNKIKDVKNEYR